MYSYYYTKHNYCFFNSINRFYKYIFNEELSSLPINSDAIKNELLFVLSEEKEEKELIDFLVENEELIVITLGFDYKSSVNIINLSELKNSFQQLITGNYKEVGPLFTKDEIQEKLKIFFHSHGEDSLFEYLNWTIYYFREGPILFITKEISHQDYIEKFLEIGIKNWNLFKNRYLKYKYFVKLNNFIPKFDDLENTINDADNYVSWLKKMSIQEILEKNKKYFRENIDKFIKIVEFLNEFYKEFQLGETRV